MQQISIDYTYTPLLIYFYYLLHYFVLLILFLHQYMLIQMLLSCIVMVLMIRPNFMNLRLLYNILIFSSFLMGVYLRILLGCLGIVGLFRVILSRLSEDLVGCLSRCYYIYQRYLFYSGMLLIK